MKGEKLEKERKRINVTSTEVMKKKKGNLPIAPTEEKVFEVHSISNRDKHVPYTQEANRHRECAHAKCANGMHAARMGEA